MKSLKPVRPLDDLMGKKTFFFPDNLANERVQDTHEKCIFIRVNGISHYVLTGVTVEITQQQFSILKDAGIITANYTYSTRPEFDPVLRPYEI